MVKLIKLLSTVLITLSLFCVGFFVAEKRILQNNIIRLHVVANSDCTEDQNVKLAVKDALLAHLETNEFSESDDITKAQAYIERNIEELELVANDKLRAMGYDNRARVSFQKEFFDTRHYDTFSLPAGTYNSLCVEIGSGSGQNWWCVVFPALCAPATTQGFNEVAASAGFDNGLTQTICGNDGYEIRFYILDFIGKIENLFVSQ